MSYLEQGVNFNKHIAIIHERKIDDGINLLIEVIEVEIKETPATILKIIQVGISSANLVVPGYEFDRYHCIGKKYTKNGKTYQSVLLRLAFWRARNFLYQNRKLLPFKIYADLTQRRKSLLDFLRNSKLKMARTWKVVRR